MAVENRGKLSIAILLLLLAHTPSRAGLGVYADHFGSHNTLTVPLGEERTFWIVATNLVSDISAYEFSIDFPDELTFLEATSFPDDCGTSPPCSGIGPHNYIGNFLHCNSGMTNLELVQYRIRADADLPSEGVLVCPGPSTPSLLLPPQAAMTTCGRLVLPLQLDLSSTGNWDGCLVVRSVPVGTAKTSWAAAKSKFY